MGEKIEKEETVRKLKEKHIKNRNKEMKKIGCRCAIENGAYIQLLLTFW